jgi:PAS domain S-box-containing protein
VSDPRETSGTLGGAHERVEIAERSFRETPDHARAVFGALAEGVLVVDAGGTVVDANPSAGRMFGIELDELVGASFDHPGYTLTSESGRNIGADQHPIADALRSGQPSGRLLVLLRPDGGRRVIVIIAMPLARQRGPHWVVASIMDVTRERQAELALGASERRFRQLIDHAPDPVIVVGDDGLIRLCNPRATDVFGYRPDELVGKSIEVLVPDADAGAHVQNREAFFTEPSTRAMGSDRHLRGRRADGSEFPIDVDLSPIDTPDGPCVIAIARDLTERVQAQEAVQADRAKSEFLSRMSHELRTPLNSVLGFAQLLALGELDRDQQESVDQILAAGRHLLNLLNDLLDFERARSGFVTFTMSPVDLGEAVHEALELVKPLARERTVQVGVADIARDRVIVDADRQRLLQVLLNLLTNAIKYNEPGGWVLVTVRERDGNVAVDVVDGGPGLDEEQQQRLFHPFERLGADRAGVPGTGVGLALSRMLVEGMGGTIGVLSAPGRGSTFTVTLRRARRRDAPITSGPAPASMDAERLRVPPGTTVLYVEDNAANVRLVECLLTPNVDRLLVARTGVGGIEIARRERPDVVLLDLNLPDLSGESVLRVLRSDERTTGIPVIVISADVNPDRRQDLAQRGIEAYLTKPIDVGALSRTLQSVLSPGVGV